MASFMIKLTHKSEYSIKDWLNAIAKGKTPDGLDEVSKVKYVKNGETIKVMIGFQYVPYSEPFTCYATYAGKRFKIVKQANRDLLKIISGSEIKLRLFAPCVVCNFAKNNKNPMLVLNVFVCK